MKCPPFRFALLAAVAAWFLNGLSVSAQAAPIPQKQIPAPLVPWESWTVWGEATRDCPRPYMDAKKPLCFWPSRLALDVTSQGGRFAFSVTVYAETWVPLPGGDGLWPQGVKVNGAPAPVVEHEGRAALQLSPGTWNVEGAFPWSDLPQRIELPREIGLLALTVEGKPVDVPAWDANGSLWLKREGTREETDKNYLSVKLNALLEDGIPLWLRTQVELMVSGKSREEVVGNILPEGWKLSAVESPVPVAVDDAGKLKAQVRAGKWTVNVTAFRIDNPKEFRFAPGVTPAVKEELVAFRSAPDFRMVDIVGPPSVDVSQIAFPKEWRSLPVYRWDTAKLFGIEERMRGMGTQKPPGLGIAREWWMGSDGRAFTFRDRITGQMQQLWRLDAAPGEALGSVRSDGEGQLITVNPQNGAPGVELRTRSLSLEATGRMPRGASVSATGWRADADSLGVTLNLPPGWRLLALFGADWVSGDWLTSWTLLDLFVLLIFSLAVGRLWGPLAGVVAFLGFGLSYHEPGAPRYVWLALLVPLAVLRHVREGWGHRVLEVWKWITVAALVLGLAPFLAQQIQQALYPQLERVGHNAVWLTGGLDESNAANITAPSAPQPQVANDAEGVQKFAPRGSSFSFGSGSERSDYAKKKENLAQDAKARIQTGPGVPDWSWRQVHFGWNGPVTGGQEVRPILIPGGVERGLTVLRVALLLALAAILLNARRWAAPLARAGKTALLLAAAALAFTTPSARAQMPDKEMLNTLRERLTEVSSAFPRAAEIPSVALSINGRKLVIDAEIHAAAEATGVPIPGRLASWSPVSVTVDGKAEAALRRADGYLWVALGKGVHQVRVEGLLGDITEWEWTFQLKPRKVRIDAPGWTYSGVRPDGTPEGQVFLAQKQKSAGAQASYDRQDYQPLAAVERSVELGLVWQVRTTVSRLSAEGKALSLRIPLLPGENVLSANATPRDGFVEVRLGARDRTFTWESELSVAPELSLTSNAGDSWVERWKLVASPVWNVTFSGLKPVFEPGGRELIPLWQPWPGESVQWQISRPEAVNGETVTVAQSKREISLGKRQTTTRLDLSVRSSLAEDFLIGLPPEAEITSIRIQGKPLPVRLDHGKAVLPLKGGEQNVSLEWKSNTPLGFRATAEPVTLPVESANAKTSIAVPDNRWTLWTCGPQMGPAVRFWGVLVFALLAAWVLGRVPASPLRTYEWMLLAVGLTQVPLTAALIVVAWFFALAWRGSAKASALPSGSFNLMQAGLVLLSLIAAGVLLDVVRQGLLGDPDMFIVGNGSHRTLLRWYEARSGVELPRPACFTVSIWWYRLAMLAWALWLASALIRWVRWGWDRFGNGGYLRNKQPRTITPPPPNDDTLA